MKKADRKHAEFTGRAGWNLKVGRPAPPYITEMDKRHVQSKLRTMTDAEVDRLLNEA